MTLNNLPGAEPKPVLDAGGAPNGLAFEEDPKAGAGAEGQRGSDRVRIWNNVHLMIFITDV